jgi:hypothetical protein
MKKFEEQDFYRKAIALDPNDPEPYYSVAVIDWTQSYQPAWKARKPRTEAGQWIAKDKANKKIPAKTSGKLPVIEDGMQSWRERCSCAPVGTPWLI